MDHLPMWRTGCPGRSLSCLMGISWDNYKITRVFWWLMGGDKETNITGVLPCSPFEGIGKRSLDVMRNSYSSREKTLRLGRGPNPQNRIADTEPRQWSTFSSFLGYP